MSLKAKDLKKFDFYRLAKVKQHTKRYERADIKKDEVLRRKFGERLKIGEKVLALAERIKKRKMLHVIYLRAQQKIYHSLIVNSCP